MLLLGNILSLLGQTALTASGLVNGVAFNAIAAWRIARDDRQESDDGDESVGGDAVDENTEEKD